MNLVIVESFRNQSSDMPGVMKKMTVQFSLGHRNLITPRKAMERRLRFVPHENLRTFTFLKMVSNIYVIFGDIVDNFKNPIETD